MLKGLKALVTGASRGIGAAIATDLAVAGADVAITYERSADKAAEVTRAIEGFGRKGVAIQANSADTAAVRDSIEQAVAALGGLDILVNNAGVLRTGGLAELSDGDIQALLDVNIRAPIIASQAVIPHLKDGGRIINVGSLFADRVPAPIVSVYAATKSAMVGLTKGLARELGPSGVTVNLVQPGSIDTDMNPSEGPFAGLLTEITALGRYGRADEVAALVTFLAGPRSQYLTGATLTVDGGATA